MKSYRKVLEMNVPARRGFVNITPQVEAALRESGIAEGLVLVNAMNITSSVFIRVTMGMGAFIQSSKASAREVLLGSTSFMLFSILFVKSGSVGRGKQSISYHSTSW